MERERGEKVFGGYAAECSVCRREMVMASEAHARRGDLECADCFDERIEREGPAAPPALDEMDTGAGVRARARAAGQRAACELLQTVVTLAGGEVAAALVAMGVRTGRPAVDERETLMWRWAWMAACRRRNVPASVLQKMAGVGTSAVYQAERYADADLVARILAA